VFGTAFVFSMIGAFCVAYWLGAAPALETALKAGLLAG